jgi:DNA-binding CsgD family transcriptional regulator
MVVSNLDLSGVLELLAHCAQARTTDEFVSRLPTSVPAVDRPPGPDRWTVTRFDAVPAGGDVVIGLSLSRSGDRVVPAGPALTPAEERVVGLLRAGWRNRRIAEALGVSQKAVEQHLTRAYRKLGVSSRTELLATVVSGP